MAYEKQNFVDDQPLSAEQLNHMEEGIAAAAEAIDNLPDEMNTARLVVENPMEQDCGVVMTNHDDGILLLEGKSDGREVILRHLAPGQNQNDAVNVWQLQHTTEAAIAAGMGLAVDKAVKETIDKTCPAFTESGVVVTCEPVEGYPLTVTDGEGAARITRCGKNLLNTAKSNLKTVSWINANGTPSFHYYGVELLLPPGSYVIKAKPNGTTTVGYLYGAITDLEGNYLESWHPVYGGTMLAIPTTFEDWRKVIIYEAAGSLESGQTSINGAANWFGRFDIQLEVGSKATAFEPYAGEVFSVGDTIPALPGVNTIYADAGEVTVTGRANPAPIINNLLDRLAAVEAAIVNNT